MSSFILRADVQHEGNLRHQLKAAGIPHESSSETWSKSETVRSFVLEQLLAVGKRNKLQRNEILKDIVLTPNEWYVCPRLPRRSDDIDLQVT
jgi:ribosomal protein L17